MAESVKVPVFSGKAADFPLFRTRFTAFVDAVGCDAALDSEGEDDAAQQKKLYSLLVLALPETTLHIIRKVDRKSKAAGFHAWQALLRRFEHDGIHRRGDLLDALDEKQRQEETCVDFFTRLLDVQAQLARVDEVVPDRRIVMNVVRGLRPEYSTMTDALNERDSSLTLDFVENLLATTGVRIERRLAEAHESEPGKTAFPAVSDDDNLRTMLQDLQREVASLKGVHGESGASSNRGNGGRPTFRGTCFTCGQRGHRRQDCRVKRPPRVNTADATPFGGYVAFPANMSASIPDSDGFLAATVKVPPYLHDVEPGLWLVDSGASHHMTSVLRDFQAYRPISPIWVKGISAYAKGVGSVRVTLRSKDSDAVPITLHDVFYVPDLASRASSSHQRLFSVSQARQRGHRTVFEDPCDVLCAHAQHGGGVTIPLHRAHGLVWLPTSVVPSVSASPAMARPSKFLWHLRLGHLGESCMDRLVQLGTSGVQVSKSDRLCFCETCALCKSRVARISRAPCADPDRVFQKVGVDFCGPMGVASLGGCYYSLAVTDFKSRFVLHDVLRTKDEAPQSFRRFLATVRALGHKIEHVRLDNDSVFMGRDFMAVLDDHGVSHDFSAPYSHWQHGRMERQWGTLVPAAKSMLHTAGLDRSFWSLAMNAAVYVRNRVFCEAAGGVPFELVTGRSVDLSHLRVFGCPAYVHVDKSRRRKLDDRAWKGIFVGYAPDSPVWLVYNPRTRRVERSRNVVFDESKFTRSVSMGEESPAVSKPAPDDDELPSFITSSGFQNSGEHADTDEDVVEPDDTESGSQEHGEHDTVPGDQEGGSQEPGELVPGDGVAPRRSTRHSRPPGQWWMANSRGDDVAANMAKPHQPLEPTSYKQALRSPDAKHWQAAIDSEYESLMTRKTWKLVPRPAGRKLVDSKWVFKLKRNPDGSIARYKARLVARGFTQEHGVDYDETFAPTVKVAALRVIMALAAHYDWEMEQLDVNTAFLEADLSETIYMRQPEGYRRPTDENGQEQVCLLMRALYGLKQAPRYWNKTITTWLVEYGFRQSKVDPCIFVHGSGTRLYILALYVDDCILAGPGGTFIVSFKRAFGQRFSVQDLGPVAWLLGMTVERDRAARVVKLGQRQYILDMLERFNMLDAKPVSTPMALGSMAERTDDSGSAASLPYQSLIGSLLYASVSTRPDITMAVSYLSRHMAKASMVHWEQGKRVLRYLKGTSDRKLVYGGGRVSVALEGYADADYAGDSDGRRSRTGFVFMLNGAAISWKSQRQQTVALSTAEAEYMALTAAAQEALFLRQLLEQMGQPQASGTVLHEDNQSCIALCKNTMTTGRSKHIDVKMHFCREKQESGEIVVKYCPTEVMLADALTKPLAADKHGQLTKAIMGSGSE